MAQSPSFRRRSSDLWLFSLSAQLPFARDPAPSPGETAHMLRQVPIWRRPLRQLDLRVAACRFQALEHFNDEIAECAYPCG